MTLSKSEQVIVERFKVAETKLPSYTVGYNLAPTNQLAIVTHRDGHRVLESARWGLIPFFAKDEKTGYKMINAKAEGIEAKPSFRAAIKKRRCLIPADGFYEWTGEKGSKQPFFIRLKEGPVFAFAGLWEAWRPKDGPDDEPWLTSCTIITTEPNELMAPLHNRMPVILEPEDEALWLDHEAPLPEALKLLRPYVAVDMEAWPVSTAVNNVRVQGGEELIHPMNSA